MVHPPKDFNHPEIDQFFETTIATAMVMMYKKKMLVKRGRLSPGGFKQFKAALTRYWLKSARFELNRYVVLMLDDQYHFLNARRLPGDDLLLGLAFPLSTPLVRIRQDMTNLMCLINVIKDDGETRLEQSLQLNQQSMPESDSSPEAQSIPDGWHVEMDALGQLEDDIVDQEPILQPGTEKNKTHHEEISSVPQEITNKNNLDDDLTLRVEDLHWQPLDPLKTGSEDLVSILQDDFETKGEVQPAEAQRWPSVSTQVKPKIDPMQWKGEQIESVSRKTEQVSLADTVLDTTFYLVPRLNEHFLLGELAQRLRMWFPKLCGRYGWELDLLAVRPDYLKWTLGYFPECLTHEMLAVVRRWTSERIFRFFPALKLSNPTQDFWSPGYLVDTQNREFPTQVLIAHVARDRSG